jgi:hypothetical protein
VDLLFFLLFGISVLVFSSIYCSDFVAKMKQNPSVKMKALNWDKIGRPNGTIWYARFARAFFFPPSFLTDF